MSEITKHSAAALGSMIDTVSAIYDFLLSIGDDKEITNAILIHLVMSKVRDGRMGGMESMQTKVKFLIVVNVATTRVILVLLFSS